MVTNTFAKWSLGPDHGYSVILILVSYVLWDHVYLATIKMSAKYENAVAYPSSHHRSLENGLNLCQGNYIFLETSHFSAEPFKKPQTRKNNTIFRSFGKVFSDFGASHLCHTHWIAQCLGVNCALISPTITKHYGVTIPFLSTGHFGEPPSLQQLQGHHHPTNWNRIMQLITERPPTKKNLPLNGCFWFPLKGGT